MFPKTLISILAFVGFCSGTPLETPTSIEARAPLSAVEIEQGLLNVQLGYQTIADHVVFLGPDGPPQFGQIVVAVYKDIVNNELKPIPEKSGPEFAKGIQLSLCNAETTYALQLLKAHELIREYAKYLSKAQVKRMIAIAKSERNKANAFGPLFAKYTPLCKKSIHHNRRISNETITDTILIFEGKFPM